MEMGKFVTALGIGVVAGAVASLVLVPADKHKLKKTPTGRVLCEVMDEVERRG